MGSAFESSLFRRIERQVALVTAVESALAAAIVSVGVLVLGQPWQGACLLGAIAGSILLCVGAARLLDLPPLVAGLAPAVQSYLGFAPLAQAGLAIGLTLTINARYPEWAPIVSTVVLGSVAVYEVIGPISTRFALTKAGEVGLAVNGAPVV